MTLPVKKGLNSDSEADLAQHIIDFYEKKNLSPEQVIDKVSEKASYITSGVRQIVQDHFTFTGEAAPIEVREEQWDYTNRSQQMEVPRSKDGRFAKGSRILKSVREVILPPASRFGEEAEFREESYEPVELGEEYHNETWIYSDRVSDYAIPRDNSGRFLKGKRQLYITSIPVQIVESAEYEEYQEFGVAR